VLLLKNAKRGKADAEVRAEGGCEGRNILSRINPIPLGGVHMFLKSGLRQITGVYISTFKINLEGNKGLIELRYGMDIVTFNLLFKFHIIAEISTGHQKKQAKLYQKF